MDWRVGGEAENKLIESPEFIASKLASGLDSALGTYFADHYCQPAHSVAFVDPTDVHFPSHVKLLHVTTLDSMVRRIWRGDDTRAELSMQVRLILGEPVLVSGISRGEPDSNSLDQLATRLNRVGDAAVRSLVGTIHDLLAPRQSHWWAAFYGEVEKYLDDGRLLANALGLGDLTDGDWLVVYVYSVAEAGLLFRPTVVEANRYAFHFVSPPGLKTGLTMPIDTNLPACAEVIHYPPVPDTAARACTGRLLRIGPDRRVAAGHDKNDDQARYAVLDVVRAAQRQRIRKRYPLAQHWLDRHQAVF